MTSQQTTTQRTRIPKPSPIGPFHNYEHKPLDNKTLCLVLKAIKCEQLARDVIDCIIRNFGDICNAYGYTKNEMRQLFTTSHPDVDINKFEIVLDLLTDEVKPWIYKKIDFFTKNYLNRFRYYPNVGMIHEFLREVNQKL